MKRSLFLIYTGDPVPGLQYSFIEQETLRSTLNATSRLQRAHSCVGEVATR